MTPDHFMETRKDAHRRYPYLGAIPETKGPSRPCGTQTNPRGLDGVSASALPLFFAQAECPPSKLISEKTVMHRKIAAPFGGKHLEQT